MHIRKKLLAFAQERMVLLGILIAGFYWLMESFMHSQIFFRERPGFLHQFLLPDAHEIWMRLIIIGLFILFAFYAQRTINTIKTAENAIRRANIKLTQIFETAADGMRVVDCDFNILEVNTTFLSMVRLKREEVLGKKCYDVLSGTDCHGYRCPMVRVLAGEEDRIERDGTKITKDGREFQCIITATPFKNENGHLIGIVEDFKDISDRKQAEEKLRKSHEQLREISSHMENVCEAERKKIAREIHDELGQALTVLKMDIRWLSTHLADDRKQSDDKLNVISDRLDETIHTVQRLSSELRPGMLDDLGLSAAIEWQANIIRDRMNITFDIVSTPEDVTLEPTVAIVFFRVFQETLTNIARHSEATQVKVILKQDEKNTIMTVQDNGRGISSQQITDPTSLGLIGMRERVNSIAGLFELSGEPGLGTTVSISISTSPHHDRDNV